MLSLNQKCCNYECNSAQDAERIHLAIKGIANDEKPLVEILGRRPNVHIQRVREDYEKLYHHDMLNKVKDDCKSVYKRMIVALIKSHPEYKADKIWKALKNNKHLHSEPFVNFIVAQDNRELEETKHYFRTRFEITMVDFIKTTTKGKLKRLLLRCLEGRRATGIEEDKVQTDLLLMLGDRKNWGSDDLLDIFAYRSHDHLLKLVMLYKERMNVSLEQVLVKETKSFFRTALMACIEPPAIFWAKRIFQGFKELEKSDCLLVCCFSQLSKPYLQQVSVEYQKFFNVPLVDEIKRHTSGMYADLLLTLIDCPEVEKNHYFVNY